MCTLLSGLSKTLRWTLVCGAVALSLSTHAQPVLAQSAAVPSELLSDDERIDFCTQMHRAATPQERSAVAARLRDTVTPRAKVQGVALPPWLVEGRPASEGGGIPGLSCESGGARARPQGVTPVPVPAAVPAPAAAPAREEPEHKPSAHEAATREAATREAARLEAARQEAARQEAAKEEAAREEAATTAMTTRELATREPPPFRNSVSGDIPVAHDKHGVAYVTGGVGQDEVAAFRGLASGYNMRATFMTGSGEYLSGVAVRVSRSDGTVVFSATSEGPYLYARLPQGRYLLTAMLDGAERTRELYVPAHGGTRLTLVWPLLHAN
jgi:hypothetical protein